MEASPDSAWTKPNTDRSLLTLTIHADGVSVGLFQDSGAVINLRMDRPGAYPPQGRQPDRYTIPFLVGLDEPNEFVYGNWAKFYASVKGKSDSFKLWHLGMALWDNYSFPEDQVVRHSGSHSSKLSVEFLLAQFFQHIVNMVESIRWDDRQEGSCLFSLQWSKKINVIVPFEMPSLARQRILNAVKVLGMTASLINECTLIASVYFCIHPLWPPMSARRDEPMRERKLVIFTEHTGNLDMYVFLKKEDRLEMIGFTGNVHFFPEHYRHDEIPAIRGELAVLGQEFKKNYNNFGRGTAKGRQELIWGLMRDMKLRLPPVYRQLYPKPAPEVCVAEKHANCGMWMRIVMQQLGAYISGGPTFKCFFNNPASDERSQATAHRQRSCGNLWYFDGVDYLDPWKTIIVDENVKELKAYDLIAVVNVGGKSFERKDWVRRRNGLVVLNLYHGTTKVTIIERNTGMGKNWTLGTLTIFPSIYEKYCNLSMELHLNPRRGTYMWEGLWGTEHLGDQRIPLKSGEDYLLQGTKITDEAVEKMKNELSVIFEYKKAKN